MEIKEIINNLNEHLQYSRETGDVEDNTVYLQLKLGDFKKLMNHIAELEKKDILERYEEDVYVRHCNECGKEMWEGFCIEGGLEYYCSEECLHKNLTEKEYEELYDNGNGDSYYTEWYDELRIYNKIKGSE